MNPQYRVGWVVCWDILWIHEDEINNGAFNSILLCVGLCVCKNTIICGLDCGKIQRN